MEWLPTDDKEFARTLTLANMQGYYDQYGITWDDHIFDASWQSFDNFEIYQSGQRVGVIRFSHDDNAVYIRDLQIGEKYRNQGVGAATLKFAKRYCQQAKRAELRLRVFANNPAKALYERLGFSVTGRDESLITMATVISPE
ncbi:GNAT family N-acetyltransferase [Vibrio zhugei]|uniref:GNAT family N-acetyltransferase n=1 Tax=Vibrio zhugei TaxID=2479546 RepID=A0ABV7C7G5_9VIBR|nr:GNAT family N-acetyltransferase [Vibrio zhugei]